MNSCPQELAVTFFLSTPNTSWSPWHSGLCAGTCPLQGPLMLMAHAEREVPTISTTRTTLTA